MEVCSFSLVNLIFLVNLIHYSLMLALTWASEDLHRVYTWWTSNPFNFHGLQPESSQYICLELHEARHLQKLSHYTHLGVSIRFEPNQTELNNKNRITYFRNQTEPKLVKNWIEHNRSISVWFSLNRSILIFDYFLI